MQQDILPNIVITDFYSIVTVYNKAGVHHKQLSRLNWALLIKSEGETEYKFNDKIYISNIENICIIPKGAKYEWYCTKNGKCTILEFKCDISYDDMIYFPNINSEKFLNRLRRLESQKSKSDPMYKFKCITETYNIILELSHFPAHKYTPTKKQLQLSPAIDYIENNFQKKIKNEDLAQKCHLSTVYFRQLFVDVYGDPPITYLHKLRINRAKELLLSEYVSISNIAETIGYANIYDFSRTFKKYTGVSPSQYLKNKYNKIK